MRMPAPLYRKLSDAVAPFGICHTERERWDAMWAAQSLGRFDVQECYRQGLNDQHIDTALRCIFRNMPMTLRTYILTAEEKLNFDPAKFTENLKAAGFVFDSENCPVKIRKPWDTIDLGNGAVCWRQWEPGDTPVAPAKESTP